MTTLTPWEVSGNLNYEKIIKEFGTSLITKEMYKKLENAHPLLRRGTYFSHRDFDKWLASHAAGKPVSVITGRGPSEKMHLGHLVPFLVAKSLQDMFDCYVYIPISDDEKFYVKDGLSYEQAKTYAQDNILDLIALGFNPKKTIIFQDFENTTIYRYAAQVAKRITYSTAKAAFGLTPDKNIGWTFYPAMQAAHILFPQFHAGKHITVVPVGIDQDPFVRLTRDIAEHKDFKFVKPAALHAQFIPSLSGGTKMSASDAEGNNVIYLSDTPAEVKKKVNKYAFSGGQATLEEHRKKGGNTDIDVSFQYLKILFEPDDIKLAEIEKKYRKGELLSGEMKQLLIEKATAFLEAHQKKKELAKKTYKEFILRD